MQGMDAQQPGLAELPELVQLLIAVHATPWAGAAVRGTCRAWRDAADATCEVLQLRGKQTRELAAVWHTHAAPACGVNLHPP